MNITNWMSWEGGVDLVAVTDTDLQMPNIIVHVARMVHTPVGSAPSGMVLIQPDPNSAPVVMGFVSSDATVAAYFGPQIFAGTPFGEAPALDATIEVGTALPDAVSSRIEVAGLVIEVELSGLGAMELVNRPPAEMPPFNQQGLEAVAASATLRLDGKAVDIIVPPVGITGGPAAVWAPCGVYAR